jgi:hypothetical protein
LIFSGRESFSKISLSPRMESGGATGMCSNIAVQQIRKRKRSLEELWRLLANGEKDEGKQVAVGKMYRPASRHDAWHPTNLAGFYRVCLGGGQPMAPKHKVQVRPERHHFGAFTCSKQSAKSCALVCCSPSTGAWYCFL